MELKYTENIYIENDFFSGCGRDIEIRAHTRKLVKTRKSHWCMLAPLTQREDHKIKKGDYAVFDKAIVDGEFGSYYTCIDCCNKLIDEIKSY